MLMLFVSTTGRVFPLHGLLLFSMVTLGQGHCLEHASGPNLSRDEQDSQHRQAQPAKPEQASFPPKRRPVPMFKPVLQCHANGMHGSTGDED